MSFRDAFDWPLNSDISTGDDAIGSLPDCMQWDGSDALLGSDSMFLVERSDFQIRLANTPVRRAEVNSLVDRMYGWRGYLLDHGEALPRYDAGQMTLQACEQGETVGTLSLSLDSGQGLQADELYRAEIDQLRLSGRKVCELTRLAVDNRANSMELLASLFHLLHLIGCQMGASDAVIEVNPRHVAFYKRLLGFQQIGERKQCARVDAPAILMHVEASYVQAQIAKLSGLRDKQPKARASLYPYFFSLSEAEGLAQRIGRLVSSWLPAA